jgi:hypothetical protein
MASRSKLDLATMNLMLTLLASKAVLHFQLYGLGLVFAGISILPIGVGIANAACKTSCVMTLGTQHTTKNLTSLCAGTLKSFGLEMLKELHSHLVELLGKKPVKI